MVNWDSLRVGELWVLTSILYQRWPPETNVRGRASSDLGLCPQGRARGQSEGSGDYHRRSMANIREPRERWEIHWWSSARPVSNRHVEKQLTIYKVHNDPPNKALQHAAAGKYWAWYVGKILDRHIPCSLLRRNLVKTSTNIVYPWHRRALRLGSSPRWFHIWLGPKSWAVRWTRLPEAPWYSRADWRWRTNISISRANPSHKRCFRRHSWQAQLSGHHTRRGIMMSGSASSRLTGWGEGSDGIYVSSRGLGLSDASLNFVCYFRLLISKLLALTMAEEDYRAFRVILLSVVLASSCTVALTLRLAARWKSDAKLGWDDGFIIISLFCYYSMVCCSNLSMYQDTREYTEDWSLAAVEIGGLGKPLANLHPAKAVSFLQVWLHLRPFRGLLAENRISAAHDG